ncbi:hypothetical protein MERGE_001386 [Pneumocystis wakefieldiae]|uniref:Protein kinase domain-containing protein n=1 Tax=Pneumocystis wakefieldiae TaxID=38082 RepID=A0A899G6G6_9ASCO|nr:hypothetical protein MERGE_001386 [Pneumocystis wakefieldiae]
MYRRRFGLRVRSNVGESEGWVLERFKSQRLKKYNKLIARKREKSIEILFFFFVRKETGQYWLILNQKAFKDNFKEIPVLKGKTLFLSNLLKIFIREHIGVIFDQEHFNKRKRKLLYFQLAFVQLKKGFGSVFFFIAEGDILGNSYTVIGILNRGSYGIVLLAKDRQNCQVAIKVLVQSSPEYKTEYEILSTLPPSEHIISYKTSFSENGYFFIVLEYYPLGDLYESIISNRLPKDTEAIRSFMLQLIDGISFLHKNGVYHRDLKPENILLFHDVENNSISVKIGDFGLATTQKVVNDVGTGSNRYMAPEQYEVPVFHSFGVYHYDASKVDIWALGICLLNIVFSKNPFKIPSFSDLIFSDYIRDPISLFDVFPNMSEDTFKVLQCSLVCSPEKRSLDEMRSAIENLLEWTVDSQYIEENTVEKILPIFNYENISTTEARKSLRSPSIVSFPYHSPFSWTRALQSVDTVENRNIDDTEDIMFSDVPVFLVHKAEEDDVEKEKRDSAGSLDSGLGTSIESYSHINQTGIMDDKKIPKDALNTAANIIFPTSVKGSKSHLLFGKSWADDDDSSDDGSGISFYDPPHKSNCNANEYSENATETSNKKDDDLCLWMLTLEDNISYF